MQNNIPNLYILKLDSFVVKSAKISTILCLFIQIIKKMFIVLPWLQTSIRGQCRWQISTSEGSKGSTHYLGDKNRFDVSSKGPSSGITLLETSNLFLSPR